MVIISGNRTFCPRGVLQASKLANWFLSKPQNFAASFLAQGASLKPRTVALACCSGVLATGPSFAMYTCDGVTLTWVQAAAIVRAFGKSLGRYEASLYERCREEIAFRAFKRELPRELKKEKKILAKKVRIYAGCARKLALAQEAAREELAQRRLAGQTKKSALRRFLAKKKSPFMGKRKQVRQTSKPESFSGLVSFLRSFDLFFFEDIPLAPFQERCPHPEGNDLEVDASFCPPIVGFISSQPCMADIVVDTNRCLLFLSAVSFEAANDLRQYVLTLPECTYLERWHVMKALSWLAAMFPLMPVHGVVDSFFPLHMVKGHDMRGYIKSIRDTAFMLCALQYGPQRVHSFMDCVRGVSNCVSSIKNRTFALVRGAVDNTLEYILDSVKVHFMGMLSPYFQRAQETKAEINKFWETCVRWARTIWATTHLTIQALGSFAMWAIITMILIGIIYIIEGLLIATGVTLVPGSLVVMFTGILFAALGYTVYTMGKEYIEFLRTLRHIILAAVVPDNGIPMQATVDREDGEQEVHSFLDAAMAPVHFLESIASGLTFFSRDSLVLMGKLGNSLEGIRKGINCLRDFLSVLLENFGGAFEYVSGKRTSFFRNLSCAVKVDIQKWAVDARKLIEYHEVAGSLDKHEYYRIRELIYQGQDMMDAMGQAKTSHTSASFMRTIGKLVEDLKKIRASCARSLKFQGWRRQPFWVYTFGASQCGKSTLANYLMPMLMSHMNWDPNDVYSKDPVDGYWSGYYQQKGIKLNDLSAVCPKNVTCLEQQLIPLISTEEKLVSSAEIEGKGVQFLSEIVVSSSNVSDAPTGAEILDGDAYRLRRKVLMQCRRAAEWIHRDDGTRTEKVDAEGQLVYKPYDASDALSCTEVRWVHPITFTALPGQQGQWHLAEYTIPMVKEAMDSHFLIEDKKMATWKDALGMKSHTAKFMSSYLQDMIKSLGSFRTIANSGSEDPKYCLIAVDGKVYKLDSTGKATPFTSNYDGIEELERITLLNYRVDFSRSVYTHANLTYDDSFHAGMVRNFLDDMLEDGASVISVDKLSSSTKHSHLELWKELGLSERIFLRVSQKALNQVRDTPHFKEHVTSIFLESMRFARDAIVDNKEKLVVFFCAIALVGITGWSFFSLLKSLASGGLTLGGALALREEMTAHSSLMSSGSVTSAFAHRNLPVVWGRAAKYTTAHSQREEETDTAHKDDLTFLLCRVVGSSGQSENAILFGPRMIALCAHQLRMFPDNDRVMIHYFSKDGKAQCFSFVWHYFNGIEWPESETLVYRDDQLTPLPVYSEAHYVRGEQKLETTISIKGAAVKKKKFFKQSTLSPVEQLLSSEEPILHTWSDMACLSTTEQVIKGPNYRRTISKYYFSSYPAGVHDSGGLITTSYNGRRVAIGLHCSGEDCGYVHKSTITLLPTCSISTAHSAPDYFVPSSGREEKGFCKIGWISNPSKRPHTGAKTALVPVEPNLSLPLPAGVTTKVPSILSQKDPRLIDEVNPEFRDYDPLKQGMDKFANPMGLLDEGLLTSVCEDIYQTWYDCLPSDESGKLLLEKVSLDVALNGVPGEACYDAMRMDTSEGYPYILERKPGDTGKTRYIFVDDDGSRSLVPDTSVDMDYKSLSASVIQSVPVLNCVECPKDELLKPGKVFDKPGTRLFDTLPFVHNILLREYFLNFCVFLQQNRFHLPCSVGINPYSKEWTWLFDRLASKSDKALNCDYSKFDGLISHQVYVHMVATINRLFKDGEEANCARRNLFLMFTSRRSIAYDQVYMVKGGMPSGCALTVVINSVLNEILVRYVYRKVVPAPARNYFSKHVELIVYGDDNLIAIDEDVVPYFDGPILQRELKNVGVTITDGTDKLSPTLNRKPLESLDFLKRGFRKLHNGAVYAPLDLGSLYSRLFYTVGGKNGFYQLDILHDNVKSFLEELYLHDNSFEEFQRVRNFYISKIPIWRNTLPTWSNAVDFMEGQQYGVTPWQPHKFIETKPHGGEAKMMAGQDKLDQAIWCTARLGICGLKYKPVNANTVFIVSIDNPLFPDESGISVRNETDRGSGALPTNNWAKKFSSPKSYPTLHAAYNDGKTILFRSRMPHTWSWCALIKFAQAYGISQTSLIAMYEQFKPRGAGDIAPIVASKAYTRYVDRPMFTNIRSKILENL